MKMLPYTSLSLSLYIYIYISIYIYIYNIYIYIYIYLCLGRITLRRYVSQDEPYRRLDKFVIERPTAGLTVYIDDLSTQSLGAKNTCGKRKPTESPA